VRQKQDDRGRCESAHLEQDEHRVLPIDRERADEHAAQLVAGCLRGIAAVALAGGDATDAATLLGVFVGLVERLSENPTPGEREELDAEIAQAKDALGNDAFDAAWAVGSGLSVDEAVEFALGVRAIEPR
jgi:hypothetical protein